MALSDEPVILLTAIAVFFAALATFLREFRDRMRYSFHIHSHDEVVGFLFRAIYVAGFLTFGVGILGVVGWATGQVGGPVGNRVAGVLIVSGGALLGLCCVVMSALLVVKWFEVSRKELLVFAAASVAFALLSLRTSTAFPAFA